jgi:hypothetical protein
LIVAKAVYREVLYGIKYINKSLLTKDVDVATKDIFALVAAVYRPVSRNAALSTLTDQWP